MKKIIIVGNGIAGHSALTTILKSEEKAEITLVARENTRTYLRTQLASYALGEIDDKKFYSVEEDFYTKNNVIFINDEADLIDKDKKELHLKSGRVLNYDSLILATGSYNFVPPTEVEGSDIKVLDKENLRTIHGVCTLRELQDANLLRECMNEMKKAVVVGGGLLGLEAAWEMKQKGIDVTVVEFSERLLPRQMDSDSAALFKEIADNSGIKLILGDSVKTLVVENNRVKGVKTSKGLEIPCDFLLFSIGIRSNLDLAKNSGIDTNRGIVVDCFMNTSAENIFACGDCCEYKGMVYGIWPFAMNSGKVTGNNVLGKNEEIHPAPLSTMFQGLNTKIFSTGSVNFDDPSLDSVAKGDKETDYRKLFFRNNILVAGILIGDTKNAPKISKAIDNSMSKEEAMSTFMS